MLQQIIGAIVFPFNAHPFYPSVRDISEIDEKEGTILKPQFTHQVFGEKLVFIFHTFYIYMCMLL